MGFSEIVSCYHQLEYKGGNFATVLSRSQFFFSADEKVRHDYITNDTYGTSDS